LRNSFRRIFRQQFNLPPDLPIHPQVREFFVHNIVFSFGDVITWLFGASFIAYNTILPVYASTITDSPMVIGLIPALIEAGWYVPQLFMVPWVERMPSRIEVIRWLTIYERLPYLGFALLAFLQSRISPDFIVSVFILLVAMRAVTGGLVALPYQELIATVMPVSHRGRIFGISHALGGLASVVGAAIAASVLARLDYPMNYATIFLTGSLFIALSYFFVIRIKEPRRDINPISAPKGLGSFLSRFKGLVGGHSNFRWFLFSRGLTFMGTMAIGFLAVYAIRHFHLPDAQAAVFTAVMMASNTIGYMFWGGVADRWGHKRLAIISAVLWMAALVTAILATSGAFFYLVFILYGLSNGSNILSDFNIAMEFGSEEDRPAYIGLTRTLTGPVLLVAPLLGGWLVSIMSYPVMFIVSLVFAILGVIILWRLVAEPRWS
jgi:MFS family permease